MDELDPKIINSILSSIRTTFNSLGLTSVPDLSGDDLPTILRRVSSFTEQALRTVQNDDSLAERLTGLQSFAEGFEDFVAPEIARNPSRLSEFLQLYGINFKTLNTPEEARAIPVVRGVISVQPRFEEQSVSAAETIAQQEEALRRSLYGKNWQEQRMYWQLNIPYGEDEDLAREIMGYLGFFDIDAQKYEDGFIVANVADRDVLERTTALVQRNFGMQIPATEIGKEFMNPVGHLGINIQHNDLMVSNRNTYLGIPGSDESTFRNYLQDILSDPELRKIYYGNEPGASVFPNVRQYLSLADVETSETLRASEQYKFISRGVGRPVPIMPNRPAVTLGGLPRASDANLEAILRLDAQIQERSGSALQRITGELDFGDMPFDTARAYRDQFENIVNVRSWLKSKRTGFKWFGDPLVEKSTFGLLPGQRRPFAKMSSNLLDILGAEDINEAAYNIFASTGYLQLEGASLADPAAEAYMRMSRRRMTGTGVINLYDQLTHPERMSAARFVTVVDTETTGLGAQDGIWQITMKLMDTQENKTVRSQTYYLKHPRLTYGKVGDQSYLDYLTEIVSGQTGSTPKWLEQSEIPRILEDFLDNYGNVDAFVAHNAGFDIEQIMKLATAPGADPVLKERVTEFFTRMADRGAIYDTRRLAMLLGDTIGINVNEELLKAGRGATPAALQNLVLETDLVQRMHESGELSREAYDAILGGNFHLAELDTDVTYALYRKLSRMAALTKPAKALRAQISKVMPEKASKIYDKFIDLVKNNVLSADRGLRDFLISQGLSKEQANEAIAKIAKSSANVPLTTKLPSGLTAFEELVISQRAEGLRIPGRSITIDDLFSEGFSFIEHFHNIGLLRSTPGVPAEERRGFESLAGMMPTAEELANIRTRAIASGYQYHFLGASEIQATAALGRMPVEELLESSPLNRVRTAIGERLGIGAFKATEKAAIKGEYKNIALLPKRVMEAAMQDNIIRHWDQAGLTLDHFLITKEKGVDQQTSKAVALKYEFENTTEEKRFVSWLQGALEDHDFLRRLGLTQEELAEVLRHSYAFSSGVQIGINFHADELYGFMESLLPKSGTEKIPWMTRYMGEEEGRILTAGAYLGKGADHELTTALDEAGRSMVKYQAQATDLVMQKRALPKLMSSIRSSPLDAAAAASRRSVEEGAATQGLQDMARTRARVFDENIFRGVEEGYKKFKGKLPLMLAGAAAAAVGYYAYRRHRWNATYNATLALQPFEDQRPSAPDPVIQFGASGRMSPMATTAVVGNLYDNRIGHSNMASDRHKYLFGSAF